MAIQYIKIIREIMGPEAEKRGYKITAGPKLSTKKYLAFFNRKISGRSQGFDIEKDYILDRAMTLTCCGKEIIAYDNDDGATFRQCIQQYQDFMMEEGYSLLEEAAKIPVFTEEDHVFVKNNYVKLGTSFFERKRNELANLRADIDIIVSQLELLMDKNWEEAKDSLLEIAGALTMLLLEQVEGAYIFEGRNASGVLIVIEKNGRNLTVPPLNFVYNAYMKKDVSRVIEIWIKDLWE